MKKLDAGVVVDAQIQVVVGYVWLLVEVLVVAENDVQLQQVVVVVDGGVREVAVVLCFPSFSHSKVVPDSF